MSKKTVKRKNRYLIVASATVFVFACALIVREAYVYHLPLLNVVQETVQVPMRVTVPSIALASTVSVVETVTIAAEKSTEDSAPPVDAPEVAPTVLPAEGIPGDPVRLTIPSISLRAAIEEVGLTESGAMGVPPDPYDVGWYALGPRPGEIGSATIAGHVDWMNGVSAVFSNLHVLEQGDIITVEDDNGALISFVVRETRSYDAAADATDIFISTDGKAHLNFITCSGTWMEEIQQYSERLVVFTDRIIQ